MKKSNLYVVICVVLTALYISCSDDNMNIRHADAVEQMNQNKSIRSLDEAISIAGQVANLGNGSSTRSSTERTVSLNGITVIKEPCTRTDEGGFNSDTLMYIIDYEDNQGFAVVSANRATEALLAVTELGEYSSDNMVENPGFNEYIEKAKAYIRSSNNIILRHPGLNNPEVPETALVIPVISPLIQTHWGQDDPAGDYCSNRKSGCAAVAIAQIMGYYKHPTSISLSFPGADATAQVLTWDSLYLHVLSNQFHNFPDSEFPNDYCTATDSAAVHRAIGRLCRQLGHRMSSTYNNNIPHISTSTLTDSIIPCLNTYNYSCSNWAPYDSACSKQPLDNGHPLIVSGLSLTGSLANRNHVWIIDGYATASVTCFLLNGGTEHIKDLYYPHINWGWDGYYDGYYLENVFDFEIVNKDYLDSPSPYNYQQSLKVGNYDTNLYYITPYHN